MQASIQTFSLTITWDQKTHLTMYGPGGYSQLILNNILIIKDYKPQWLILHVAVCQVKIHSSQNKFTTSTT